MPFKHEAVVKRGSEVPLIDPRQINIVKGLNPRKDFDTEEDIELMNSIIANGVLEPIRIKKNAKGGIDLVHGQRRLHATLKAIKEGHDIKGIPAIIERKTMSETQIMLIHLNANTGKRLTPTEEANAYKQLKDWGMSVGDIAKATGKQIMLVYRRLKLVDASPELQKQIDKGEVNVTDAEKIVKESAGSQKEQNKKAKAAAKQKAKTKAEKAAGKNNKDKSKDTKRRITLDDFKMYQAQALNTMRALAMRETDCNERYKQFLKYDEGFLKDFE